MDVAFMHDILTRLITHGWLVPNGQCDHKITTKRTGNYGVMSFVFDLIGDNDNNTHLPFHISISLSSIVLPPTTSSQCTTSETPSYRSQKPEARRAHRAFGIFGFSSVDCSFWARKILYWICGFRRPLPGALFPGFRTATSATVRFWV